MDVLKAESLARKKKSTCFFLLDLTVSSFVYDSQMNDIDDIKKEILDSKTRIEQILKERNMLAHEINIERKRSRSFFCSILEC